ncbi:MAG TPA: hypothetical protein DIC56_06470 [Rhizobium sp.]|nr:hypothetical protein [Rhizobium sp.]
MPKSKTPPPKRHHTERFRAPGSILRERWTPAQSALAGFLYGQHHNSVDIARALGPDILPATVRAMIARRWKLPRVELGQVIEIRPHQVKKLERLAAEKGMAPEAYLRKIVMAAIKDDLFAAIVPKGEE